MTSNRLGLRVRRGISLGSAVVLATSVGALAFTGTASAAAPEVYNLSAEAVALDATTNDPGIPLGIPLVIGSYGASSRLTSNGESMADAGAPYSPLLYSLPTTGNGIASSSFGVGFPTVPTFPGYVVAKDPVAPLATQNAGGYELTATAEPDAAIGKVGIGSQSATATENNLFAYASTTAGEDGVLSTAAAGAHALTLDGIVDIANVSTRASLADDGFGGVTPHVATDLGTISFAGLNSGLSDRGLAALGTEPTPITTENLDALNAALEPAGISLSYLPASYVYTDGSVSSGATPNPKKTVSGLTSGALRIVLSNTSDRGTTTETFTVGRVRVAGVSSTVGTASTAAGSAAGTGAGTAAGTTAAGAGDAATVPSAGGLDLAAGTLPGTLPSTAGQSLLTGAGSLVADGLQTQTFIPAMASSLLPEGTSDLGSAYLVLAAAAAVAMVGAQAVRVFAGRGR